MRVSPSTLPDPVRRLDVVLRPRVAPSRRSIRRRFWTVHILKWLLPFGALVLLGSIAAWPELQHAWHMGEVSFAHMSSVETHDGLMRDPRYRGVDARNRPYTLTATSATQVGPERINLVTPKGDMVLQNGTWLMVQSDQGVYMPHTGLLDLFGNVVLYRQDGTTITSDTSTVDVKQGAASSYDQTHAEGPFGTLDAHGYTLVDHGAVVQFQGPAHLVLNSARR